MSIATTEVNLDQYLQLLTDNSTLGLALRALTEAFDTFISECTDSEGSRYTPSMQAVMKARGYLPPGCANAFKPKVRNA